MTEPAILHIYALIYNRFRKKRPKRLKAGWTLCEKYTKIKKKNVNPNFKKKIHIYQKIIMAGVVIIKLYSRVIYLCFNYTYM